MKPGEWTLSSGRVEGHIQDVPVLQGLGGELIRPQVLSEVGPHFRRESTLHFSLRVRSEVQLSRSCLRGKAEDREDSQPEVCT